MYTIISIDFESNPFKLNIFKNFLAEHAAEMRGNVVQCTGCYEGTREHSFMMRREDFDKFIRGTEFVKTQETALHIAGGNKMETKLEYLADGSTHSLGCMHSVCDAEAQQSDNWTHVPGLGYYIAKRGNPDNSYRNSVAQYETPFALAAE